jgi:hypothetical protein
MAVQARSSLIVPAIIAGIIGGIIVDTFLCIIGHKSPIDIWTFVGSTVAGPGAPWVVGLIAHFVISIVWAILYVYAAKAVPWLGNWIVGAIVWGIVVDAVMNGILAVKLGAPWGSSFSQGLLAHVVFYALPVTLYLSRYLRAA